MPAWPRALLPQPSLARGCLLPWALRFDGSLHTMPRARHPWQGTPESGRARRVMAQARQSDTPLGWAQAHKPRHTPGLGAGTQARHTPGLGAGTQATTTHSQATRAPSTAAGPPFRWFPAHHAARTASLAGNPRIGPGLEGLGTDTQARHTPKPDTLPSHARGRLQEYPSRPWSSRQQRALWNTYAHWRSS